MSVWYSGVSAQDPTTGASVTDVDVQIFASDDEEFATPLTVQGKNGLDTTTLRVSGYVLEGFWGPDEGIVRAKSGTWWTYIEATSGLRDDAQAARDAAETAADAAAAVAAGSLPLGGSTGQVLTKLSNDDYDAGWITPTASGSGSGILVIEQGADVPAGTLPGTFFGVVESLTPPPTAPTLMTGSGNVTTYATVNSGDPSADRNFTFSIPANVAVGDVLFCVMGEQSSSASADDRTWTAPSGWVQVYASAAATNARITSVYRYSVTDAASLSSLGSTAVFSTQGSITTGRRAGVMVRGMNFDTGTPVVSVGDRIVDGTTTATLTAPASAGDVTLAWTWTHTSEGQPDAVTTIPDFDLVGASTGRQGGTAGSQLRVFSGPPQTASVTVTIDPASAGVLNAQSIALNGV